MELHATIVRRVDPSAEAHSSTGSMGPQRLWREQAQVVTAQGCLHVGAEWCTKRARVGLLGALRALRSIPMSSC
jgi:hypothetical protein